MLNRAYDFKSHAVRPTWTQVLRHLSEEYAAQAELEQCIAATKAAISAANMSRQGLSKSWPRCGTRVAQLAGLAAANSCGAAQVAESRVDRRALLAAAEPHAGCCDASWMPSMADFDELPAGVRFGES